MNFSNSSSTPDEEGLPEGVYWSLKCIISTIAVIGNGLVTWLICTRRRLHCTANWFVLSLALADLFTGFFITPLEFICFLEPDACIRPMEVRISLYNYPINVSICCLCILTFDRYFCVLHPLKYTGSMTSSRVAFLVASSWVFPGILTFVSVTWLDAPTDTRQTADKVHIIIQITLVTCFPSVFLTYTYSRIFFAAMKQRRRSTEQITQLHFNQGVSKRASKRIQSQRGRDRSSTVKVLGLVIVFFVLCWILTLYRAIYGLFLGRHVSVTVVQVSRLLILLNSGVNFVVYAFFKRDIRTELYNTCRRVEVRSTGSFQLKDRSSKAMTDSRSSQ